MFNQIDDVKTKIHEIEDIKEKLGETIYDCFEEDDNFTCEIGKSVLSVIENCKTKAEFDSANNMLMALCGYSFNSILNNIEMRDKIGYLWNSIY